MKGFTLIETMVAIAILTLAVAGPLYTASRAIVAAESARDQLTASYLAQEGIEYVRALRDREFLATYPSDDGWDAFITGIERYCLASSSCTLDPSPTVFMGYGSGFSIAPYSGNAPLYRRPDGLYTIQSSGNTQTIFTRTIQVVHVSAIDERIISTVSWGSHGTPYTVKIYDHLTPWQ